jgi:dTDP-4-dehydrorhamnose reductase
MTGSPVEVWGGIECTVARIRDRYVDQTVRTGHHDRLEDLDLFAALGIRALRYPVLWERAADGTPGEYDWRWTDERLGKLRALRVRPIATLLHHGSGPAFTSLVDDDFVRQFTEYARAVARRYPWIEDYTPINEPLTTARFSGLYGHWYPHRRDAGAFVKALLNEVAAIASAMQAIRAVSPGARLIQTEDAGRVYSSPRLAYQAGFENQRRWLTFDLLGGRVDRYHPLRDWLVRSGGSERVLDWLCDEPCMPDVVGLNYYLTSDRYLDERINLFPVETHGGNGRHAYADVEAVRVLPGGIAGHREIVLDAWQRYRAPVAITEAHAGCTREDQVRWLLEAWRGALDARDAGADVRAVTAWALLGSFDWHTLLAREDNVYEPGAFDVRSDPPRPTALATAIRALASTNDPPAFAAGHGWWRRPDRIRFRCHDPVGHHPAAASAGLDARPLLIAGARGTLGSALVRACEMRGIAHVACGREDMDLTRPAAVANVLARHQPWAIINAAGYVRVDDAEGEEEACRRLNVDAPVLLAQACAESGMRFVTFSSDLVFDGAATSPYVEEDTPSPLNVYGSTKAEAERRVAALCPSALILRTSAFFGPWDRHNFLTLALERIALRKPFVAADDLVVSPTYVPHLAAAVLDLLLDGETGIWHVANPGHMTWAAFASLAARRAGLDPAFVVPAHAAELGWPAPRPRFSALATTRGTLLPSLEEAVDAYLAHVGWNRVPGAAAHVEPAAG